jgi:hypothetical protein
VQRLRDDLADILYREEALDARMTQLRHRAEVRGEIAGCRCTIGSQIRRTRSISTSSSGTCT